ncbi:type II toxin-antitoxin system VapB family antitoxin [Demequina soli]|uniref:type II toxin-antitoxin system VapB family antitoxin n=1 Tax=Demequina soli TaxID=1638987 RepID=UPI0007804CBB|nr:type II toxin-antitoxin system VapB family antitoxin [Demequina soli]
MSLNISDPRTVALVRALAARTGANQTSAIEEAVRMQLERLDSEQGTSPRYERLTRAATVLEELDATTTPDGREGLLRAERDLYDEVGLPR